MSPKPSVSIASALVNSSLTTESTEARESHQISTITSAKIEAILQEDLGTHGHGLGLRLREEMEKFRALVAEREELIGQLAKQIELVESQAQVIENLQDERNHFLALLLGVCIGLFFVIFGQS